jgi:predicted PurR-regulated permease PerM
MLAFWLDYAIFFGLLTFLLNFIPNIGSIIAVVLPTLFSLAQSWFTFSTSLFMFMLLSWVQLVVWQILDPQFMGNRLNLSPLVIVLSLAFWWMIWWIIWMLLCVPIMVIVNIILAKIPATKPIAILLSEKWDLQVESQDVIDKRKKLLKSFKDRFDTIDLRKKKK